MQNKLDLLISFDDTGSMSTVRKEVRSKISNLTDEIFQIYPDVRIGLIIHNDYCDRDLIQKLDFTSDKDKIQKFIQNDSSTGGGDYAEAYAYVLNSMKSFGWTAENKVAILIGDAPPHEKGKVSAGVKELFDWRTEVTDLKKNGISVYPIQALANRDANYFYDGIANISSTVKLQLSQFAHITQYVTAIVHKQNGSLDEYENSNEQFRTNISFKNMFAKLKGIAISSLSDDWEKTAEMLGRFQVMNVDISCKIKDFVERFGLKYTKGRGFYQLVNTELVQENKEVIFVDKKTGETIFDTKWCREQIGLPYGKKGKVNPKYLSCNSKYDIFIQSNSYTRDMDLGTKFLYELNKS